MEISDLELADLKSSDVDKLYQLFKLSILDIRLIPFFLFPEMFTSRTIRKIL